MTTRDDAYLDPYRRSVERHGPCFEAALWASRDSQRRRFEVFTQMAFLPGKRILDAGCGRGDFARFLIEHSIDFDRYVGVDALPEVIDFARTRNFPHCEFHQGDLVNDEKLFTLSQPQIICISGTLNTMTDEQALGVLDFAWRGAGQVLLFNFLSGRAGELAPPQTGPARRIDPLKLLDWALARTTDIAFRQDYFPQGHDATIRMRKQGDSD